MYLKKVEMRGFKSFGDLVKLDIPPGITAVIGPNGCGKSNIADAMRWVLGEQSAKLLRGDTMQDVIFSGTQNRNALGYAQVSMTIDNSNKRLPIEYSEVVITRRVYRSGESEYLINNSVCRLMDIHELFMGTGVGKEGYSIIGQGQIDKILSSRPEDRRNLFEEAAGVYKYKLRKLDAEKKLDQKQENLIRIQDILSEIEGRLETLEKQAKKAKKYMDIRDVLKELELNIFIYEADKIEEELSKLSKACKTLKDDYSLNNENLEATKKSYEGIRVKLARLQESSTQVQNNIMTVRMDIEQNQGNTKVNLERINAIDATIKRLKEDNQQRNTRSIKQETQKESFGAKALKIQKQIEKEKQLLTSLESDFQVIDKQVIQAETRIENDKSNIYEAKSKVSGMEAAIRNGATLKEQIDSRRSQIDEISATLATNTQHLKVRFQVLEKNQIQSKAAYENLLNEIKKQKEAIGALNQEQEDAYQLHRSTEDLYHKAFSRHNVLLQMKNEYEGFYRSVKNILSLKEKHPGQWEKIYGVVGEVITVPKNLETAIHTALGNSVQHIITQDEQTANRIIEHIKKNNLGRATFLPISAVKGREVGLDGQGIPKEEGVIGFADGLIGYDPVYKGVMSSLLGRVVVIDNMKNAILLAKKYKYRYRIVTLEGEILNPGGSITGGSFQKDRENIFSRNREVKELNGQISNYKQELSRILKKRKQLDEEVSQLSEGLTNKQVKQSDLEKQLMELNLEKENAENRLEQYGREKTNLDNELAELKEREKTMHTDIHDFEASIEATNAEIEAMKEQLEKLTLEVQDVKDQKESVGSKITDVKVSLSSKAQILKATRDQKERIEEEIKNSRYENQSYHEQVKSNQEKKELYLKEIEDFNLKMKDLEEVLKGEEAKLAKMNEDMKASNLEESEKRKSQDEIVQQSTLLQNEIYKVEGRITKLNLEKENIYSKVWEKYEVTYQAALEFKKDLGTVTQLRQAATEHRAKIRGLGIINTGAIEEFDETRERYEFMKGHEEDIITAEETLLKLINNLTQSMEEIFKEQFKKISDNFNIVFTELFGGGEAFLELTDSDDVLESGIEIIARPPGKKLQNMMLLSGGERALTAIAILFGILRLKPSPFAVLDEIEASLDDANVLRFANYLKSMGDRMQFVIITHRKGTMAVADTIYGVTMEEKGVSKVLSVQLDDIEDIEDIEEEN